MTGATTTTYCCTTSTSSELLQQQNSSSSSSNSSSRKHEARVSVAERSACLTLGPFVRALDFAVCFLVRQLEIRQILKTKNLQPDIIYMSNEASRSRCHHYYYQCATSTAEFLLPLRPLICRRVGLAISPAACLEDTTRKLFCCGQAYFAYEYS